MTPWTTPELLSALLALSVGLGAIVGTVHRAIDWYESRSLDGDGPVMVCAKPGASRGLQAEDRSNRSDSHSLTTRERTRLTGLTEIHRVHVDNVVLFRKRDI